MGEYSRLVSCPACGGKVVIYTETWLGESKSKASIEAIQKLALDNCAKCKEVDNDTVKI